MVEDYACRLEIAMYFVKCQVFAQPIIQKNFRKKYYQGFKKICILSKYNIIGVFYQSKR